MSVLKNKRTESKAEFVNKANNIYVHTLQFITRLSARYARLISSDIMNLASEVLDNSEKAQSIFPNNDVRKELREKHLLEARASLMCLDVHMTHCYSLLMLNPQGSFEKKFTSEEAIKKIDSMAQTLGEEIDDENKLLTSLLNS